MMLYKVISQDSSNYSNSNCNNNTKYPKLISISVNNKSGYCKQFTTILEMI